jgi:drug/metabolite transporter (DMT)-like permease
LTSSTSRSTPKISTGNQPQPTLPPAAGTGYLLAATAALLWGTSGVTARFLFSNDVRPFDLLMVRTVAAALLHWLWLGLTAPALLKMDRRDLARLAVFGIIGLAFNQGCYYLALKLTSVGYALLLQYTAPLLLMGYGVLAKTERLTAAKLSAGLLALIGCALMMGGQTTISWPGTLAAFGSAIAFAFYSAYGQQLLKRYDSRTVMTYAFSFAGLTWLVVSPVWQVEWQRFDQQTWLFVGYLSTLATVVPFGLYLASLRHLEPSRANLTSALEPVIAAGLAWVWLGEAMQTWQIAGGAAVLLGVVLLQLEDHLRARWANR